MWHLTIAEASAAAAIANVAAINGSADLTAEALSVIQSAEQLTSQVKTGIASNGQDIHQCARPVLRDIGSLCVPSHWGDDYVSHHAL